MTYILALDIGTSALKAVAFSPQGQMLFVYKATYSSFFPAPGYAEQDPSIVFKAVKRSIRRVIRETGGSPEAVCFSSAMHSILAVDRQGRPLTNCLTWQDNRSKELAAGLRASLVGAEIYRYGGPPIHPMLPLCKIKWMQANRPDIFGSAFKWVSIKAYILFHLCGEWLEDYSLAAASGLWDNRMRHWSATAMDWAGISRDKLADPVLTTFKTEKLRPEVARSIGLNPGTPVIAGASDGCLANLGSTAGNTRDMVVTIGTSSAVRINHHEHLTDEKQRIFSYWLDDGYYVVGGPSNNGGGVIDWLLKQVIGKKSRDIGPMLGLTPPGADNLLFLPYLFGERAPIWDANASAGFIGLTPTHTKSHLLRAAMEGIIFNLLAIKMIQEEKGRQTENVVATGGFAYSAQWVQILADVFGQPVVLQENPEASALGAAILGMKAMGWIGGYEEARAFVKTTKVVAPIPENQAVYQKLFPVFSRFCEAVGPVFRELSKID